MGILDKTELDFIKLYMSGITGKTYGVVDVNIDDITKLAFFHSVGNAVYYGLKNHNITPSDELIKNNKLLKHKTLTQDLEFEEVKRSLEENNIRHIFLKGIKLRKYYKIREIREMGDIDFLVDTENLEDVGKLLIDMGYEFENHGINHDIYIKKPFMNLEVHSKLFDESSLFLEYNSCVWDNSKKVYDTNEYEMDINEFFVYIQIHASHHFTEGGTGIKIIGDTLLLIENEELDFEYINNRLEKFGLNVFTNLIIDISKKLSNNDEFNDDEETILKYIISSGTYGIFIHKHGFSIGKSKGKNMFWKKIKTFFRRLFPKYSKMVAYFPKLKKCPILLPYYYIVRLIRNIGNTKRIKEEFGSLKNIDQENIDFLQKVNSIVQIGKK